MKKKIISVIALLGISFLGFAQNQKCGTTEMTEEAIKNNPDIRRILDESEAYYQQRQAERASNKVAAVHQRQIVPVVVHIMHEYGQEYITEAQVLDAIRVLNLDFQRLSADSNQIASAFFPIRGNTNLEFRLAQKDPNGNCTSGITRTYTTLTGAANDNVKALLSWDTKKYLNIWVANTVISGSSGNVVGGYAYYPCSAPSGNSEGVIVTYQQFGSIQQSTGNFAARTLPHEVGHALSLAHTWGSTNEPGLATNCSSDDGVTDTPNCIGVANQSCNLSQVTCGTLDNVNNIMDYSSCARMFTEGQSDRMRDAIDTTGTCIYRRDLSKYANLVATGVADGFIANCAPKPDFSIINRQICQGTSLTFNDLSYQATVDTRQWVFEGGTPATSTNAQQVVTYNTPGVYKVKLIVSNANGIDSLVRTQCVTVISSPGTIAVTSGVNYTEGIEEATWPVNSTTNSLLNWTEESTSSTNWERTTSAFTSGTASARIKVSSIPNGRVNSIISPVLDLSAVTSSTHRLFFKLAYAQRTLSGTGSGDQLRVLFSTDCGTTWLAKYTKTGSGLNTTGTGNVAGSNFIPTASQWRTESVSLSQIAGKASVMMKFESTSNTGTIIYVDDINISPVNGIYSNVEMENESGFNLFPNPTNGDATITYTLTENSPVKIVIKDILGKSIGVVQNETQTAGTYTYSIAEMAQEHLSSGVYFVSFTTEKGTLTKKFVKN